MTVVLTMQPANLPLFSHLLHKTHRLIYINKYIISQPYLLPAQHNCSTILKHANENLKNPTLSYNSSVILTGNQTRYSRENAQWDTSHRQSSSG